MFSDAAILFVDACKVSVEITEYLTKAGVQIKPYEEAISYVRALSENEEILKGNKIWCDGKTVNHAFYGSVHPAIRLDKESPITIMKSTKNEVSTDNMKFNNFLKIGHHEKICTKMKQN